MIRKAHLVIPLVVAFLAGLSATGGPTARPPVVHAEPIPTQGARATAADIEKVTPEPLDAQIYTSPIDITGLKLLIQGAAPDRNSGQLVTVTLPLNLLPPKINQYFATPMSTQIDQLWAVVRDPNTGLTQREVACAQVKTMMDEAVAQAGAGYSVYDFSCNLAPTGLLLFTQVGSLLYFGYLLTNNTITAYITTPYTCNRNRGTPFCPNDPGVRATFALELVTTVRTVDLCNIFVGGAEVGIQALNLDIEGIAEVAQFFDTYFLGGKYESLVTSAITQTTIQLPLPMDAAFEELRTSDACTGDNAVLKRVILPFREVETIIEPRQGVILRMIHAGIGSPTLDVPDPSDTAPRPPSFSAASISTDKPVVAAGQRVTVSGSAFPPATNFSNMLPVVFRHSGYGGNSIILGGGPCLGGATELEWRATGGAPRVERLAGDAQGKCIKDHAVTGLTPGTTYQFRARDCDAVTCSPWSSPEVATTSRSGSSNSNSGRVTLTLDTGANLGTVTAGRDATFIGSFTIPANTPAGVHKIRAVSGNIRVETEIEVTAAPASSSSSTSSSSSSTASPPAPTGRLRVVELLFGQTGCPGGQNEQRAFVDEPFRLFGSGFTPGRVEIRLGSATGLLLGSLTAKPDGTLCGDVKAPTRAQRGSTVQQTLYAVQNGTVRAQHSISIYVPEVIH